METTKITANDAIISMLASMNAERRDLFYKSADDYANTLAKGGSFYYKIKRLVSEKPMKFVHLDDLPNDIKKLIQQSDKTDENVFLNDQINLLINDLLIEWDNRDIYEFHNLPIRNKILLHGTTGNGKTTIARHIARLSNLPFVEINADLVIDSRVGSSGQNISKIFNQINEPCVLFWDEVDTIGRKRGIGSDSAAGMENERMVNSILVNIEKLSNKVIFIGATNRRDVLDTAFLRRFDIQFELSAPDESQKKSFSRQIIEYYKLPETYINNDLSSLNSYSEIKMMIMDLARKYVLSIVSHVTQLDNQK